MNNRMDIVNIELNREQIFTLFNHLFISEPIFKSQKEANEELLKKLWIEASDREKIEALWNKNFRGRLEYWNINYKDDLKRLDILEVLENDE